MSKHHRSPLSSLNRNRKASPTVSLTNTNANASCINTSVFSSPTSIDLQERNFIPFPTSTSLVPFSSNSAVSKSDCTALLRFNSFDMDVKMKEAARQVHMRPRTSQRRRRPPAHVAQSAFRSHGPSSSGTQRQTEPVRPPKRKRLVGDTQFLATIHRSIVWMMMMGNDAMEVDGEEQSSATELKVQDTLLVGRLTQYLSQLGWNHSPIEPTPSRHAYQPYYLLNSQTPHPTSHASLPLTTMAPKTPTLVPILTMPQLVASLIITRHERSLATSRPLNVPRICAASASPTAIRPRSPLSSEL